MPNLPKLTEWIKFIGPRLKISAPWATRLKLRTAKALGTLLFRFRWQEPNVDEGKRTVRTLAIRHHKAIAGGGGRGEGCPQ
jgi:hypothetical protein